MKNRQECLYHGWLGQSFVVGLLTAGAHGEGEGLGFFEPFEFLAEGGLQSHEQGVQFSSIGGAPLPARMIFKSGVHHQR
jgi:hypothetical protein